MDPVSLIVGALAAGASSGLKDSASTAVRDTYQQLRDLVGRLFAGNRAAETVLEQAEHDPHDWDRPLRKYITETGAERDGAVLEAAQRLMTLLDSTGSQAGKYHIDARYAQGAQFGDHNVLTVTFAGPGHRSDDPAE